MRMFGSGKIGVASLAAALLASSVLTACGGDSSSSGGGGGDGATTTTLVSQLPAAKGDVSTVKWNLTAGEPDTLDPRNAVTFSSGQVVKNLCDSLLGLDSEFNVEPNLATVEQPSDTEVVINLRDDATFWDGSPVTAEDVAYSLERSAAPDSVVAYSYTSVASIDVTGEHQVTVKLSTPDSIFTAGLATVAGAIVKKEWTESAGDKVGTPGGGLMCSGPYQLTDWKPGSSITITRNDKYWNKDLTARAEKVEFSFVTDATALAQALGAGELDGAYELPANTVPGLQKESTGKIHLGPSTQSVAMNVAIPDGPFKDVKLRQAFQLMLDREAIAKVIYHGAAEPLYTMLTPTTWPNDQRDLYAAAYKPFEDERAYDLDAAKKLVEQSSYDGATIVVAILAGEQTDSKVAQLVQQQAKAIGVNVKIQSMQPLVWAQAGYDASLREGIDLLLGSSFNSGQEPLEPIGFMMLPGQFYNYTDYDDPEVTNLINSARATLDPTERAKLIIKAQEIYEQDSATIPIVSTNTTTFLANDLTGAITSFAYWSMPQMAYVGSAS
jgi:peptide/nickel transport system substrate-binding protein